MVLPNYNNILDKKKFLDRDDNLFVFINFFLDKITISVLTKHTKCISISDDRDNNLFVLINFYRKSNNSITIKKKKKKVTIVF